MITIYHNPKCSKSRSALTMIRDAGIEPEIILYLDTPPDRGTLTRLIADMGCTPRDILRPSGAEFDDLGLADPTLTDDALIDAMLAHPILINRPIVVGPNGTVLARPPERVRNVLNRHAT